MPAPTDTVTAPAEIRLDTQQIEPVQMDREKVNAFKKNKNFDYTEYEQKENWWTAFKNWLGLQWSKLLRKIFGSLDSGTMALLGFILKYVLIFGILFFIVWLYVKLDPGTAFFKAKTPPEVLLSEDEKIIRQQDIPQLINQALKDGNYRLAVRYHFLLILKQLKDQDLIDYQFQKTNREYSHEIEDPDIARQFTHLARLYDFTWYGDFQVNARQYDAAEKDFTGITQMIKPSNYA